MRRPLGVTHDVMSEDLDTAAVGAHMSPVSWRTRVDFPAPFGPSRPKISPRRMSQPYPVGGPRLGRTGAATASADRRVGLGQRAHQHQQFALVPDCLCRARTHEGRA